MLMIEKQDIIFNFLLKGKGKHSFEINIVSFTARFFIDSSILKLIFQIIFVCILSLYILLYCMC